MILKSKTMLKETCVEAAIVRKCLQNEKDYFWLEKLRTKSSLFNHPGTELY